MCKAAQMQRVASCWINMKYLSFKYLNIYLAVEVKGLLFYDSVRVLRSASQFWFPIFRLEVAALRSARGMCPRTDRASCTRAQRSGELSALLSENTQTDRRSWIILVLTTWQLLWCRDVWWCLQFFFSSISHWEILHRYRELVMCSKKI